MTRFKTWLYAPFLLPIPPAVVARNVAFVRIVWGLGLVHRYVDIAGFAIISDRPREMGVAALCGAGLSLCVALGVATPLALWGLLIGFIVNAPFGFTLGQQVQAIVVWGLLLLGAGRTASVDALLARVQSLRPLYRVLYVWAVPLDPATVARVRWLLMALFWFMSLNAAMYHAYDPYWRRGEVLQIMITSAVWVREHAAWSAFRDASPLAFRVFCIVALFVQLFWEVFFLPLMYSKWTRLFAVWQGLAFYVVSFLYLPLGYLPFAEICMWLVMFNYPGIVPWRRGPPPQEAVPLPAEPEPGDRPGFPSFPHAVSLRLLGAVLALQWVLLPFHAIVALPPELDPDWANHFRSMRWMRLYHVFGQHRVNVVNANALVMGDSHMVVYETDRGGEPLRVVPLADHHGRSLSFWQNDLFHYSRGVFWQRLPVERKFTDADLTQPTYETRAYMRQVAVLDARLQSGGGEKIRYYRARFFKQPLQRANGIPYLGEVESAGLARPIEVSPLAVAHAGRDWPFAYDLPPGHGSERERLAATLAYLRNLPPDG